MNLTTNSLSLATEQGPAFEAWNGNLGPMVIVESETPAPQGRLAALRAHLDVRPAWQNNLILGITAAVLAALIVHFATAASADSLTGPSLAATQAAAAPVNLRLADVPGFRVGSGSAGVTATGDPSAAFTQCFGTIAGTAGVQSPTVNSPAFVVGGGLQSAAVGSSVALASDTQLAGDAALAGTPSFPQCFSAALASVTWSAPGVSATGSNPTTTPLPAPVAASAAVDPILSMRASTAVNAGTRSIPVTIDVYVVTAGHDELTLYAYASGAPFSAARERRLVALLVHRALGRRP